MIWSRAYRRPLSDIESASMKELQSEYHYVCEMLAEQFKKPRYDDLQSELLWYQAMNEWLQRLKRVHHEYGTRRHVANEIRKKYEQESVNSEKEQENA